MAVFRGFDQDSNHNIQIVLGLSGAELRGSAKNFTRHNGCNKKIVTILLAEWPNSMNQQFLSFYLFGCIFVDNFEFNLVHFSFGMNFRTKYKNCIVQGLCVAYMKSARVQHETWFG